MAVNSDNFVLIVQLEFSIIVLPISNLVWHSRPFTFYYWGHGEGKGLGTWPYQFVLPHIHCSSQLPLANYREWPSSTAYRNSYTVGHPFKARL